MEFIIRRRLAASPDDVWVIVGDFTACDVWCPADTCIATGSEVGAVRTVTGNGLEVQQQLTAFDPAARSTSYTMDDTPDLPWADYLSHISVAELTSGCELTWSCEVTPLVDESVVITQSQQMYERALENLVKLVEPPVNLQV